MTLAIIRQEPTPAAINIRAPTKQSSALVSPTQPCTVPKNADIQLIGASALPASVAETKPYCTEESVSSTDEAAGAVAKAPSAVAPLKPSTAVQTLSPLISPA